MSLALLSGELKLCSHGVMGMVRAVQREQITTETETEMKPVKQTKKTTSTTATKAPVSKPTINASATTLATAPVAKAEAAVVKAVAPFAKPASALTSIAETKRPQPARGMATTIEARVDVGFGNQLFVRGQGAGLSWEHGVPLKNVDSKTWQLSVAATDKVTFKLLLNDCIWAQGADVVAAPGQKVEVAPRF